MSHEMSGFDAAAVARSLGIPENYQAVSVTAIGYYGDVSLLPEDMQQSEMEERKRRSLSETVFSGMFGEALKY